MSPALGCTRATISACCETLEQLRDMSNTVLVVEHDEETIRRADYVIDLGPGAGKQGGYVVAAGHAGEDRGHTGFADREVPLGRAAHSRAGQAAGCQRKISDRAGGAGQQPEEHRRAVSLGAC